MKTFLFKMVFVLGLCWHCLKEAFRNLLNFNTMLSKLSKLLYRIKSAKARWIICVASAFISMLSFFNINSYMADSARINGLLLATGIFFGAVALCFLIVAASETKQYENEE